MSHSNGPIPHDLDTEPMHRFVLESGSGHPVELVPSRTDPPTA